MRALALNCTLKSSAAESNTAALAQVVLDALEERGVATEMVRVVDHNVLPGVKSDGGEGDEWPALREKVLAAEILIIATPTWLGQASSHSALWSGWTRCSRRQTPTGGPSPTTG